MTGVQTCALPISPVGEHFEDHRESTKPTDLASARRIADAFVHHRIACSIRELIVVETAGLNQINPSAQACLPKKTLSFMSLLW